MTQEKLAHTRDADVDSVPRTVVCVTDQRRCDRIIRAGRELADLSDTQLAVINVARPGHPQDPVSIEYLFSVSKQNSAEMTVLYSDNILRAIARYIRQNQVAYVVTGLPQQGNSVATDLRRRFGRITFFAVEPDGGLREIARPARAARTLCKTQT